MVAEEDEAPTFPGTQGSACTVTITDEIDLMIAGQIVTTTTTTAKVTVETITVEMISTTAGRKIKRRPYHWISFNFCSKTLVVTKL